MPSDAEAPVPSQVLRLPLKVRVLYLLWILVSSPSPALKRLIVHANHWHISGSAMAVFGVRLPSVSTKSCSQVQYAGSGRQRSRLAPSPTSRHFVLSCGPSWLWS